MEKIIETITETWEQHGQTTLLTGMIVSFILAVLAIWRTAHNLKNKQLPVDTIVSTIVTGMILALSAEGMFVVLTTKLGKPIPAYLAWAVCAVVEGLLIVLFREAKKFNDEHGRPGPYGTAFWIVALAGGAIVAASTTSLVEVFLRLALPASVAMLHWIKLTAKNSKTRKITWLITPTRIMARLGFLTGEEETLSEAQIKRQTEKLVRASYLFSSKKPGTYSQKRAVRALRKKMLAATPEIAAAAEKQILLTYGMEHRISSAVRRGQNLVDSIDQVPAANIPELPKTNGNAPKITLKNFPEIKAQPATQQLAIRADTERDARDRHIMNKYRQVFLTLRENGVLNRSQIERACSQAGDKVLGRQANRLLAMMEEELGDQD